MATSLHSVVYRPATDGRNYAVVPLDGPLEQQEARERFTLEGDARARADVLNAEHLSPAIEHSPAAA
jgi:hypothetical protein